MAVKYPIPSLSQSKEQEKILATEDAWLNDVAPAPQPVTRRGAPNRSSRASHVQVYEQETMLLTPTYIGIGHPLWPLVLHLSTRIWQECYAKPDNPSCSTTPSVKAVQKRALELIRAEPTAQQVQHIVEARSILKSIVSEVLGYGPLETWMKDERISEMMFIGPGCASIRRAGTMEDVASPFANEQHMERIIANILRLAGRHMRADQPLIDVYLPDGSLVNIIMPPHAMNGPTLTMRKSPRKFLTLADLVEAGTLTSSMADFLYACIQARLNIVICGTPGSGRTTLLNALGATIPAHERITTIEEVAELHLPHKHAIGLVSQLSSPGSTNAITLRDLVAYALRLGPERLLLGECRGNEFVELLHAMANGLSGMLMTLYANDPRHCLHRLETLYLAAGTATPLSVVRSEIATTLDVIVHIVRLPDGSHKIGNIAEVLNVEHDVLKLQSIFHYRDDGFDARTRKLKRTFEPAGFCPTFLPRLEKLGIVLPPAMFQVASLPSSRKVPPKKGIDNSPSLI